MIYAGSRIVNNWIYSIDKGYVLIDTGYESGFAHFKKQLAKMQIAPQQIQYIFYDDHAGYLNEILSGCSDIQMIMSDKALERLYRGQNSFHGGCTTKIALFFCSLMKFVGKGKHLFPPIKQEYMKTLSETKPFIAANFIAAFLFGIWHIVMPIRSYVNGEMSFAAMFLMGIGYIILAGIMGVKWGLLYRITGNLWAGLGDHLFNNTVATNMLHAVSQNGADELQIVRIMAAQIISFGFVAIIHIYRTANVR